MPYSQQWNFAVQREMPWDAVLEVGYYANQTIKLTQQYDINQPPPMAGNLNANRPQKQVFVPGADQFITIGQNRYTTASSNANFHSLQARYEKRYSSGFTLLTTYIWSKTINDSRGGGASGGVSNANPQDVRNLRAERSLADEHVPHRFINSYVYELPFGRGRKYMAGITPIVDTISGRMGDRRYCLAGLGSSGPFERPGKPLEFRFRRQTECSRRVEAAFRRAFVGSLVQYGGVCSECAI